MTTKEWSQLSTARFDPPLSKGMKSIPAAKVHWKIYPTAIVHRKTCKQQRYIGKHANNKGTSEKIPYNNGISESIPGSMSESILDSMSESIPYKGTSGNIPYRKGTRENTAHNPDILTIYPTRIHGRIYPRLQSILTAGVPNRQQK